MTANYDLKHPDVIDDPYPLFAKMREEAPVHWNQSVKAWVVTRHADAKTVLSDPRFSVEKLSPLQDHLSGTDKSKVAEISKVLGDWMVFKDPPTHTRLRRVLQGAFKPRALARLRPMVEAVAEELLDTIADKERIDFIHDFAWPFPATVIADLMGIERRHVPQLKDWAGEIGKFVLIARATPDKYSRAAKAVREISAFYHEVVADHRRNPRQDLITLMIDGGEDGADSMSDDEIVSTMVLMLFAGHETTTNLLANGMLNLLRHDEQMKLIQEKPELIPLAVEEFLRYEGSVQVVARLATEDIELNGATIARGDRIYAITGAANRDPERFERAEHFDITRAKNPHYGFGLGIHLCLGAPLARIEVQVAFEALLRRFTDFKLEDEATEWSDEFVTRAQKALPISFKKRT
jgi:cytochrome P450